VGGSDCASGKVIAGFDDDDNVFVVVVDIFILGFEEDNDFTSTTIPNSPWPSNLS
jgi:hypothetical protein